MSTVELIVKVCTKCGEEKPLSEFYRDAKAPDGRSWTCKKCDKARVIASQQRRRAEIGEEAWRAKRKAIVDKHRSTPEGRRKARLHSRARDEALSRLAKAHPREFRALLDAVRYEKGLT